MSTLDILAAIQTNAFAHAIAQSNHLLIAAFQIVHVFGFIFLLAPSILLALRLLGLVLPDQPLSNILRASRRLVFTGLAMALGSGLLMFLSGPMHYYYNWAFDAKMILLLTAILIQVTVFALLGRRAEGHPGLARLGVSLSILAWIAVSMAGRAIGFV